MDAANTQASDLRQQLAKANAASVAKEAEMQASLSDKVKECLGNPILGCH